MERILHRFLRKLRRLLEPTPESVFALRPEMLLPTGIDLVALRTWLQTVRPVGAPKEEMACYCGEDFERFVRTWQLADGLQGECLELGANPYFTTMLLRRFNSLRLTLANYFGEQIDEPILRQDVTFQNWQTNRNETISLSSHHFNVEKDSFPFADSAFDVVLFCEILEHLLLDPLVPLREIQRVLKIGGTLIL